MRNCACRMGTGELVFAAHRNSTSYLIWKQAHACFSQVWTRQTGWAARVHAPERMRQPLLIASVELATTL